jgi:hypothetical protein
MRRSTALGIHSTPAHVDFGAVMDSVQKVIGAIAPNDSMEMVRKAGRAGIAGRGAFHGPPHGSSGQHRDPPAALCHRDRLVSGGAGDPRARPCALSDE